MNATEQLIEKIVTCSESFESFQVISPSLIRDLSNSTRANIQILLNITSRLLSSEDDSSANKFYALYLVLKVSENSPNQDFIGELALKKDLISYVFQAARYDSDKELRVRGRTFFVKNPNKYEACNGINFVRLSMETLIYWGRVFGKKDPNDQCYIFFERMEALSNETPFPPNYRFIGKTYHTKEEVAIWDFEKQDLPNTAHGFRDLDPTEDGSPVDDKVSARSNLLQEDEQMVATVHSHEKQKESGQAAAAIDNLRNMYLDLPQDNHEEKYSQSNLGIDMKNSVRNMTPKGSKFDTTERPNLMDQVNSSNKNPNIKVSRAEELSLADKKKISLGNKMAERGLFIDKPTLGKGLKPTNFTPGKIISEPELTSPNYRKTAPNPALIHSPPFEDYGSNGGDRFMIKPEPASYHRRNDSSEGFYSDKLDIERMKPHAKQALSPGSGMTASFTENNSERVKKAIFPSAQSPTSAFNNMNFVDPMQAQRLSQENDLLRETKEENELLLSQNAKFRKENAYLMNEIDRYQQELKRRMENEKKLMGENDMLKDRLVEYQQQIESLNLKVKELLGQRQYR